MHRQVDVAVVGGGPAGYSVAIRAAQSGLRVLCIERENVGGVCLNWGCIPSKALITAARRYHWAQNGASMGIRADNVSFDLAQAQKFSRGIVKHHTDGVASLLQANGAELLHGSASFENPTTLRVVDQQGGSSLVSAQQAIVIATGLRPHTPPGFTPNGDTVVTAREAVFFEQLPEHLIVLGGGVIGLELGSAYLTLGAKLTVVELGPNLLPGTDPDLVRVVERRLERQGANVMKTTRALAWEPDGRGLKLRVAHANSEEWITGNRLLVATGFRPDLSGFGLARAGIEVDATGHIATDASCRTSARHVFAIGDVSGPPYLAHKGFKEAEVVSRALLGKPTARDWAALPAAIFTDPEIATTGLTENEANAAGIPVSVGRFPFSALGRAMALGETDGFVKLITHEERLVGMAAVGPEASELIAEGTVALEMGASVEDLALTIHAHPTLSEAVREAADHALGQAVHVLNRRRTRPVDLAPTASAIIGTTGV